MNNSTSYFGDWTPFSFDFIPPHHSQDADLQDHPVSVKLSVFRPEI
jgi:hypothetical protein